MVLNQDDRRELWAQFMRKLSALRDTDNPLNLTKVQLREAVDAVDDWVDANAASLNQALPESARNALSVEQKAMLLKAVVTRRVEAQSGG
jgi:hypothetical protein